MPIGAELRGQSVERRNSGALSEFTGSILALSTGGVSTLPVTSARVDGCSERGRAVARAISIDAPAW